MTKLERERVLSEFEEPSYPKGEYQLEVNEEDVSEVFKNEPLDVIRDGHFVKERKNDYIS